MVAIADATVVVPTLGRVKTALELAARLERLDPLPERTLFVFQDPSELSDWENSNTSPRAKAILAPAIGASVARNSGAEEATTRYIAFLDDDCCPMRDDWLLEITKPLQQDAILLSTGPVEGWLSASSLFRRSRRAFMLVTPLLLSWGNPEARSSWYCHTVAGGNFSIERDLFRKHGGFLEAFGSPSLYEETELSLRVTRGSRRSIWYSAQAPVVHNQESSGGMRMVGALPSRAFVASQKDILLKSIFGPSRGTQARITAFRVLQVVVSIVRRLTPFRRAPSASR